MSVGCYGSSSNCHYTDIFVESLTASQASAAAAAFPQPTYSCTGICATCSRNSLYTSLSATIMTVENCLKSCITTYSFKYGGIQM